MLSLSAPESQPDDALRGVLLAITNRSAALQTFAELVRLHRLQSLPQPVALFLRFYASLPKALRLRDAQAKCVAFLSGSQFPLE